MIDDEDTDPPINLAQPRDNPFRGEVIRLDDPEQVKKLIGTRIGVQGPGAEAIVEKLRAQGVDVYVVDHPPGKTTLLSIPSLHEYKPEFYKHPKEKAQWKRERRGRR